MNRINVLSQETANRIAAGEVVERPASVVKELVENALDAGSTAVTVEILSGGIDYIRVSDNGGGILKDDVGKAFLPHATSKITVSEDLEHIETLGFRGEALASIAAVSKVSLKTRAKDELSGSLLCVDGGQMQEVEEFGCPEGTTVEVSDLFYNVPVRLKFLKHARSEASAVSDYVSRMILSHPGVSFHLISNARTVYHSMGDGSLYNAIYCVYGADVLPHLREVHYDDAYMKITGYLGTEQIARPTRNYQSFFVNGRYIRSPKISFAVQRAFDTRLMVGKFPFLTLDLRISSREVDVNVHPNKLEVRFKDDDRVIRAFYNASRMALAKLDAPDRGHESETENAYAETTEFGRTVENLSERSGEGETAAYGENRVSAVQYTEKTEAASIDAPSYSYENKTNAPAWEAFPYPAKGPSGTVRESQADFSFLRAEPAYAKILPERTDDAFMPAQQPLQLDMGAAPYKIVGVLFDSFWVVQQNEDIFFIDQHAMHERRLYEQMTRKGLRPDSQMLLIPMVIRLSPLEFDTLISNIEQFEALGFEMEEFGPLTMNVRAVPHVVGQPQTAEFLHEALSILDKKNRVTAVEVKHAMLIQSACKHAIKAGDPVTTPEIEALLTTYQKEGIPMTCPHGRPVMVKMTRLEFEKLFKRVV
ncbi:MAG TPA: DNA mismatch repair endonuclease MutL [Clostridia bacterium]|nr:DNA mismatch repair endonuclease MutL [Clostridia bacterium]